MVKLIAVTKPVGELEHLSSEELISYVARVSNPSNQMNTETAPKLLNYCIKNSHWSVFEHNSLTLEITTTRAIAAQILRHRSFVFQEFSQRYAKSSNYIPCEARAQDVKNRQNSTDTLDESTKKWFEDKQQEIWKTSKEAYDTALFLGVAKECARMLFPLNTETTLYMTGNLRSWIHYINLRSENGTQKEHSDIALACKKIICEQFPNVVEALGWL